MINIITTQISTESAEIEEDDQKIETE